MELLINILFTLLLLIGLIFVLYAINVNKQYKAFYANAKAGDPIDYYVGEERITARIIVRKGNIVTIQFYHDGEVQVLKVNIRQLYPSFPYRYKK